MLALLVANTQTIYAKSTPNPKASPAPTSISPQVISERGLTDNDVFYPIQKTISIFILHQLDISSTGTYIFKMMFLDKILALLIVPILIVLLVFLFYKKTRKSSVYLIF